MLRVLQFILHGCWHDWHPVNARPTDHFDMSFGGRNFMYRTLPTRCAKCGRIGHIKDHGGSLTYADLARPTTGDTNDRT